MLYVGLDIHKSHITVCVLDSNGKVFQPGAMASPAWPCSFCVASFVMLFTVELVF